jgi:hypothetical protein
MRTAPALSSSEAVKAVVWRNTEEVQTNGRFDVFDELFADDFVDHTPQPDSGADKEGCATSTRCCAPPSRISVPRYIGSVPTATR